MTARIREAWERVKSAGIDVLTEGIRLAQTAGEHVLQQIAERQLHVPPALHGVLERLAGREPARGSTDDIDFVCKPAGPDTFACQPAREQAAEPAAGVPPPKPPRRKAPKRASQRPPAKAATPRRPRKKAAAPPVSPPSDPDPTT